jgi:transposase-like protein
VAKKRAKKAEEVREPASGATESTPNQGAKATAAPRKLKRSAKPRSKATKPGKARPKPHASRGKRTAQVAKPRRRYSPAERQRILAAARRAKLTGAQVAKRFGISPITYYVWKKKGGAEPRRKRRMVATGRAVGTTLGRSVNLVDAIRHEVRAHIGRLLPDILKSEVGRAVGGSGRRRR